MTSHERKKIRTEYFFKYIYKNKLVTCSACSGSGWYGSCRPDGSSIPCGGCDGTGKERQR